MLFVNTCKMTVIFDHISLVSFVGLKDSWLAAVLSEEGRRERGRGFCRAEKPAKQPSRLEDLRVQRRLPTPPNLRNTKVRQISFWNYASHFDSLSVWWMRISQRHIVIYNSLPHSGRTFAHFGGDKLIWFTGHTPTVHRSLYSRRGSGSRNRPRSMWCSAAGILQPRVDNHSPACSFVVVVEICITESNVIIGVTVGRTPIALYVKQAEWWYISWQRQTIQFQLKTQNFIYR